MAGLTLGYMSLDGTQLEVLSKTGTAKQRIQATRILPILKNRHLLLVTLLLSNMILNETLPIIAEGVLGSGIVSVVVSTALVIIFGEIIPQSICTTYGLVIGSTMVYPVQILIWAFVNQARDHLYRIFTNSKILVYHRLACRLAFESNSRSPFWNRLPKTRIERADQFTWI